MVTRSLSRSHLKDEVREGQVLTQVDLLRSEARRPSLETVTRSKLKAAAVTISELWKAYSAAHSELERAVRQLGAARKVANKLRREARKRK